MRWKIVLIGLLFLAALTLGLGWLATHERSQIDDAALYGPRPMIGEPRRSLIPTLNVAEAVGWKAGETPTPASGLAVRPFATGLDHPRWLYELPNGDVLVAESNAPSKQEKETLKSRIRALVMGHAGAKAPSADRITLLRDADGDGMAEARSVLLSGLRSPFGIALIGDQLYVASADAVLRFPYTPGATKITASGVKVVDLPGGPINHHWTKNILASPDGQRLYVTVGSNSNVGENGRAAEEGRAAVWEVELATGRHRIFAGGIRNPNGLAWEPTTGALWTVVNERDELGSDLVPDYLTSVDFGDNYGWPDFYWGGYPDKRVEDIRMDQQSYIARPDYALGAHTAPLGLAFADRARLGSSFTSGAFIGQHGSWNRRPLAGYRVIFVPFASGQPKGKPIEVLGGFVDTDGKARGRPVGVITDRRGGLLVADDVGNAIWRVSAAR